MATFVTPRDRPSYYTAIGQIAGEDVLVSDITQTGDCTGVAGVLDVIADEDETAYVGALTAMSGQFPPLPTSGWLEEKELYQYGDGVVMVRQSHNRTIYPPEDTPALFIVWREDADGMLEWVSGEQVQVGTQRQYDGVTYRCIQAHVTQEDWTPPATPALWAVVPDDAPTGEWRAWTAYTIGDKVTHQGAEYECRQSHTSQPGWEPPNVPALWLKL